MNSATTKTMKYQRNGKLVLMPHFDCINILIMNSVNNKPNLKYVKQLINSNAVSSDFCQQTQHHIKHPLKYKNTYYTAKLYIQNLLRCLERDYRSTVRVKFGDSNSGCNGELQLELAIEWHCFSLTNVLRNILHASH